MQLEARARASDGALQLLNVFTLCRQFMGLKTMDMGPTLRMLRTLSESPTDSAERDQAGPATSAFRATRPAMAAMAAESASMFAQSPIAKQYREVCPMLCCML